jgi:putative transposase
VYASGEHDPFLSIDHGVDFSRQSASERPPPGLVHHSGRGSQYASGIYCQMLAAQRIIGSMSRRGNPNDNAKAESFTNTLKVEAVYPMAFELFDEVAEQLPHFIE